MQERSPRYWLAWYVTLLIAEVLVEGGMVASGIWRRFTPIHIAVGITVLAIIIVTIQRLANIRRNGRP